MQNLLNSDALNEERKGAREGLRALAVEISATAALMAAAAVGLRGKDAKRAQADALKRAKRERWSAVCAAAVKRRDSDKLRYMRELEARTRAVLSHESQDDGGQ